MKFGVGFWLSKKPRAILDCVRLADRLGFHSAWFNDHYFLHDTLAIQAAAAMKTKKISFGNAVISPFLRHPSSLASSVATVAELSGGRAILGIGPGGYEFPTHLQLPIRKPLTATREAITIIRKLWTGQQVSYRGQFFKVNKAQLWDTPRFKIPVYLGARGAKMLQMGGEICDGIITHGVAPAYIRYVKENVKKGAMNAGKSLNHVDITTYTRIFITDRKEDMVNRVRTAAAIMAGGTYSDELLDVFELDKRRVEQMRKALIRSDFDAISKLADDKVVESFLIVGNAKECRARLAALQKAGLTHVIMGVRELPGEMPRRADLIAALRLLAKELTVTPHPRLT